MNDTVESENSNTGVKIMKEVQEDPSKSIEALIQKAVDYGKTSLDLIKLKTLDKSSDFASSLIPRMFVLVISASFLLFVNLGLALWLGELMGNIYYGFFLIASFYGILGLLVHFVLYKWIKRRLRDYLIKHALN
jgi:hypothetical protein